MDTTTLFTGLLFGSIGMGYLVYGKKQQKGVSFLSGLCLCVIPYFTSNLLLLAAVGLLLIALPFIVKS